MKVGACAALAALLLTTAAAAATPPSPGPATPALADPRFADEMAAAKTAMMTEPGAAFAHARQAAQQAAEAPPGPARDLAAAAAAWLQGEASVRMRRPEQADAFLDPALATVARIDPDSKLRGDLLRARGRAAGALGRVQAALADFQSAFQVYQRANEPRSQAMVLQDIGAIYLNARDYAHGLQYYRQAGETYSSDPKLALISHNNTALALKALGRPAEALTEFRAALAAAGELKSAYLEASILTDLAAVELSLGLDARAAQDVDRGLALAARDDEARGERPFLLTALARLDEARGDDGLALQHLSEAFDRVDLEHTPMEFRDHHEVAARIYEHAGRHALAFRHLRAFKRLDDQARELAASTNSALMSARFDFTNQNLKLTRLKAQEAAAQARLHTLVLTSLVAAVSVLGLVAALGFLYMRRSRDRIRAANDNLGVANAALERALQARTEFLATTSHEIRTPLNGILGMTQIILADRVSPQPHRERLELVQAAGETMKALVDDLLDVAKMETGEVQLRPAAFDLHAALTDARAFWSGQAEGKGLRLTLDCAQAPRRIVADAPRLRQVLHNLMSNAIKFTEAGEVSLRVEGRGDRLCFEVKDTGVGIPAAEHQRIFEPFTQVEGGKSRRFGGTGLGLSICRRLVTAMDGELRVESAEGRGSCFRVELPLERAPTPAAGPAASLAEARLLVIDPNPLTRARMSAVLRPACAGVSGCASLEEAAALCGVEAFDAVLAEATAFPRGDAPAPSAHALRGGHAWTKVVLLRPPAEADPPPPSFLAAVGALADATVQRPITGPDLIRRLAEVVAGADPEASVRRAA